MTRPAARSFGVHLFYGEKGWMTFPDYGSYKMYEGRENKLVREGKNGTDLNHYRNFIECVRNRDAAAITAPPIRRPPVVGALPLRAHRRARQPGTGRSDSATQLRQERRRSQQDADAGIPRTLPGPEGRLRQAIARLTSAAARALPRSLSASEPNPCAESAWGGAGGVSPSGSENPSTRVTPIRFRSRSMLRISKAAVVPTAIDRDQPSDRPVGVNVEACASASTPVPAR